MIGRKEYLVWRGGGKELVGGGLDDRQEGVAGGKIWMIGGKELVGGDLEDRWERVSWGWEVWMIGRKEELGEDYWRIGEYE